MNLFKSRGDKEMSQWQSERDSAYRERLKEEEEARREAEEDAAERQEYIDELEEELIGEDTTIIPLHIEDDEWGWKKQICMNFMFKHGYVCVQNSVSYSVYNYQYYDLTFVKKEEADFFRC